MNEIQVKLDAVVRAVMILVVQEKLPPGMLVAGLLHLVPLRTSDGLQSPCTEGHILFKIASIFLIATKPIKTRKTTP